MRAVAIISFLSPPFLSPNLHKVYLIIKDESTQKSEPAVWKSTIILVPDGIWTDDLRIRNLAC